MEKLEYRFGYLISSRRPLKEHCRDRRIEASAFWNIFGFSHHLGLLDGPDALALVTEPVKRSLTKSKRPDLNTLWTNQVAPLVGRHPALIQMLLFHHWNAWSRHGLIYWREPRKPRSVWTFAPMTRGRCVSKASLRPWTWTVA